MIGIGTIKKKNYLHFYVNFLCKFNSTTVPYFEGWQEYVFKPD